MYSHENIVSSASSPTRPDEEMCIRDRVYDSWGANLIRLPINPKYWKNGSIWDEKNLTKEQYQKYIDDMVTVSYTHLDVYKRQHICQ